MRMLGNLLFDRRPLKEVLADRLPGALRMVERYPFDRPTPARIKRLALETARFADVPTLGAAGDVIIAEEDGQAIAVCEMPFDGDAAFFQSYAPQWPEPREIFGLVDEQVLTLSATSSLDLADWLPTLIASEMKAIERYLAGQLRIVNGFNAGLESWAREVAGNYDYGAAAGAIPWDMGVTLNLNPDFSANLNSVSLPLDLWPEHLRNNREPEE